MMVVEFSEFPDASVTGTDLSPIQPGWYVAKTI